MVCSVVVTPDTSTGVCFCRAVNISCGLGCGSSQNGLGSLSIGTRNSRTRGSRFGSVATFGSAAETVLVMFAPRNNAADVSRRTVRKRNFFMLFLQAILAWLEATHVPPVTSRRDLTAKEIADERHHFVRFVLECKMPCVDQVKLDLGQVALVRVSAVGREDLVILAPDDERRRLMLAEICLQDRIKRQIGAIVVE